MTTDKDKQLVNVHRVRRKNILRYTWTTCMRHRDTSLYRSQVQRISITSHIIAFAFHSYTTESDMNMKYANVLSILHPITVHVRIKYRMCVCKMRTSELKRETWGKEYRMNEFSKTAYTIHSWISNTFVNVCLLNQFNSLEFSFCLPTSSPIHTHTH